MNTDALSAILNDPEAMKKITAIASELSAPAKSAAPAAESQSDLSAELLQRAVPLLSSQSSPPSRRTQTVGLRRNRVRAGSRRPPAVRRPHGAHCRRADSVFEPIRTQGGMTCTINISARYPSM